MFHHPRVRELEGSLKEKNRQLEIQRSQISNLKQQCAFYQRLDVGGAGAVDGAEVAAKRQKLESQCDPLIIELGNDGSTTTGEQKKT